MNFLAAVAGLLLLANISAEEAQDGAPRIKVKVNGLTSSKEKAAVEKSLRVLASTDDVLAGKDGTVTILMKQSDKALTLRLSEIARAVKKAGGDMSVNNGKTLLDGKFHVEVKTGSKGVLQALKAQRGVKSVGKGALGKGTVSFVVEAKGLNLGALMKAVRNEKIDIIWTSPAKKKSGGGG